MNIFKLANLLPEVMQKGKVVANPEAWKSKQITAGMIAALISSLVALSKAFGYEIPLTETEINDIAIWILGGYGMYNIAATIASSDKVGVKSNDS